MKHEQHIAVFALRMPNGTLLHRQVLVFAEGKLQRYYPLTAEEAFTKWYGGTLNYTNLIRKEEIENTPISSLLDT